MSYAISVYFNDETIESTDINDVGGYYSHTGYYGDSSLYATGFTTRIRFTVNPADGCVFSHWVYRYVVDGVQSDAMDSTEYPFYYDGSEGDLIIRAVGEEEYVEPEDPEVDLELFKWTNKKKKGEPFNLTAIEWNRLTKKINEIRDSMFLDLYDFTMVRGVSNGYTKSQSTEFKDYIYNEVVEAINTIPGYEGSLISVERGDPVTADCLNDIKDIVNEIIENG